MKPKIHPNYSSTVPVTCACGHTFTTGSTMDKISIEVCSNCHPFYTGVQKLVDTAGRVDKFGQRTALKNTEAVNSKKIKYATRLAKKKTIDSKKTVTLKAQ